MEYPVLGLSLSSGRLLPSMDLTVYPDSIIYFFSRSDLPSGTFETRTELLNSKPAHTNSSKLCFFVSGKPPVFFSFPYILRLCIVFHASLINLREANLDCLTIKFLTIHIENCFYTTPRVIQFYQRTIWLLNRENNLPDVTKIAKYVD